MTVYYMLKGCGHEPLKQKQYLIKTIVQYVSLNLFKTCHKVLIKLNNF